MALYAELHFPWLLATNATERMGGGSSNSSSSNNTSSALAANLSSVLSAARAAPGGLDAFFSSAYSSFQRVAVALDLVESELRRNGEFAAKFGRFWRLAQQTANRAAEAAFVLLRSRRAQSVPPMVPRSLVPRPLRCVAVESRRNLRDWVVLKDSLRVASFYSGALHLLRRENAARRRSRQRNRQRG